MNLTKDCQVYRQETIKATGDAELDCISFITSSLESLSDDAHQRVLRYVCAKYLGTDTGKNT